MLLRAAYIISFLGFDDLMISETPRQEVSRSLDSRVKGLLRGFLLPEVIDSDVIEVYVRKALRVGVWRFMSPESRALMRALARWRGVVKSRVLKELVEALLLEIELCSLRGRAVLYGLIIALKEGLTHVVRSVKKLMCLGISYLSNPPLYRYYG